MQINYTRTIYSYVSMYQFFHSLFSKSTTHQCVDYCTPILLYNYGMSKNTVNQNRQYYSTHSNKIIIKIILRVIFKKVCLYRQYL